MSLWTKVRNAIGTGLKVGVGFAAFNWSAGLLGYGRQAAQQWMGSSQGGGSAGRGDYSTRGMYLRQAQTNARLDRIEYNQAMLNYRLARAGW